MIAVDTNILVYAHRGESPFHREALAAIDRLVMSPDRWALPWPCVHEFLSVVTNRRIQTTATPLDAAFDAAAEWLKRPNVVMLAEADGYGDVLRSMLVAGQVTGPKVHDARIAAICLQHGVSELWSADRDFTRFPALKVINPLVAR